MLKIYFRVFEPTINRLMVVANESDADARALQTEIVEDSSVKFEG